MNTLSVRMAFTHRIMHLWRCRRARGVSSSAFLPLSTLKDAKKGRERLEYLTRKSHVMRARGVSSSAFLPLSTLKDAKKGRVRLEYLTRKSPEHAWKEFHKMRNRNAINAFHISTMINCLTSSAQTRAFLEKIRDWGFPPTAEHYSQLVYKLYIEGSKMGAKGVLDEMHLRCSFEGRTKEIVESYRRRTDEEWGKLRSGTLKNLIKPGPLCSMENAWFMFNRMEENNVLLSYHYSIMMKALETSSVMAAFLDKMRSKGVLLNEFCYSHFITQLIIEGEVLKAQKVIEIDLERHGTKLEKHVIDRLMQLSADDLSRMRSSKLLYLKKIGKSEGAHVLMDRFVQNDVASIHQVNALLNTFGSVEKLEQYLDGVRNQMNTVDDGLAPNAETYESLGYFYLLEGARKSFIVKNIIRGRMRQEAVQPTRRMMSNCQIPPNKLFNLRMGRLKTLRWLYPKNIMPQMDFLEAMDRNGIAEEKHREFVGDQLRLLTHRRINNTRTSLPQQER